MCGRATLVVGTEEISEIFDLLDVPAMPSRYNIAPTQPLPVIREPGRLELVKWGPKPINVKIETATTKPGNRCLVVLDGFYEWRTGDRQPFYFHRPDGKPFAVAGVTRSTMDAAAIVTCPAVEGMIDVHHRMPLVLRRDQWEGWLNGEKPAGTLDEIERYAVSTVVNSYKNDDPRCIEPVELLPPLLP